MASGLTPLGHVQVLEPVLSSVQYKLGQVLTETSWNRTTQNTTCCLLLSTVPATNNYLYNITLFLCHHHHHHHHHDSIHRIYLDSHHLLNISDKGWTRCCILSTISISHSSIFSHAITGSCIIFTSVQWVLYTYQYLYQYQYYWY
jgi:hypothetical protein